MKKLIASLLVLAMSASMLASCESTPADTDGTGTADAGTGAVTNGGQVEEKTGTYTYQDSVSLLASNWNPHTYQTNDDGYPAEFLRSGLYTFVYNDALHPVEGKDSYAGYAIVPEMAASEPVDVTEKIKAEHPEFNIPETATAGYAYTIDLNQNCKWEDGTPITADDYVYSMQQLLRSDLKNYRATDYYAGDFCIAGAQAYALSGTLANMENATNGAYSKSDLTLGDDGQYYTPDGCAMYIGLNYALAWTGGETLDYYVQGYGESAFVIDNWDTLMGMADSDGLIPLTDANYDMFVPVVTGNPGWGETEDDVFNYLVYKQPMEVVDFSSVGCYKSGDYQITLVLGKALAGFNLLYNLSSNWLVKQDLYDSCLRQDGDAWFSSYNTSVETTSSYGPYKLTEYQADKFMKFERNENWWGYTDGNHTYVDPTDGQTYTMYMTDVIETEVVSEASTRKMMFLKGDLMEYGLQSEDFDAYRGSEYAYATPSETIYFLILNGHKSAIQSREAAEDFDQSKYDIETLMVKSFRQALAVTYDKEDFAATVSPARSGGYGIIGSAYLYDPETGSRYRDTDQAKKALCQFYSVDVSKYASLDEAVDSITGYDPETAKVLYQQAFEDSLAAGYITDNDGDGKCDQTIRIEYALGADASDMLKKTLDYLNTKGAEVMAGTPFEGKVEFYFSAVYGNEWSTKIKQGQSDTVLAGWSGSALNPFSLTDLYVNPDNAYDGAWFDATTVDLTINIGGEDITMTLKDWSDALNGATVNGRNYGDGIVDVETRLDILAACEVAVLQTYNYLPMLQNGTVSLLSKQIYYVVDDYNPVMGRGGIPYIKYNYNDEEWAVYVKEQGGELKY